MKPKITSTDWMYLGIGLLSTWWLTQQQLGKHPELECLSSCLRMIRTVERGIIRLDRVISRAIDRELDNYGN